MIKHLAYIKRQLCGASLFIAIICLFGGCNPGNTTGSRGVSNVSSSSVAPSTETDIKVRVANITKQLSRSGNLPGALLDAHFLEEKIGDGVLGPSDFFAFYALKIPVADIPAWQAALATSPVVNNSGTFASPKSPVPWWISEEEFFKLELFGPKPLTGRYNGWLGISPDGRIFIYSFTM
jgi:hypothetical protein